LIEAVAQLDYPPDRLQVQVLDDSTDDTTDLLRCLVRRYRARGLDIHLLHRCDRRGYKAGALQQGLKTASGEFVAVFDADFVPPADWLKKTIPEFQDVRLGCLQTRWGHLNDRSSTFTRAQSLGIDGHFIVEQTARSHHSLFMNFNGTAGLWRTACIESAGGWQSDTLTEDLDLSYRAQLRGWRFDYLPDVVVPAELPAQIEAFKKQQFRWAKGSIQTLKKLAPVVLKSDAPWYKKLLGILHLSGYLVHPLILATLLLLLPVSLFNHPLLAWTSWSALVSFGPPLLYLLAETEHLPRFSDRLRLLPILIIIGTGISLNNTLAVLEGFFKRGQGTFIRTPKYNLTNRKADLPIGGYAEPLSPMILAEIGLGLYALLMAVFLGEHNGLLAAAWPTIYMLGFFYIAGQNLVQSGQVSRRRRIALPAKAS
jgi:cellulose synthase/poly-beta-1,6-N-acetylglucosamine synthase-like glycosyltransferase